MVVELPLDVAEACPLSSSAGPVAGPAPIATTAEREVVVAHPRGEEVQDEGLHVRQVGGVAAKLLHVPPHLRRVSPLLGEVFPYVHLSFLDLQTSYSSVNVINGTPEYACLFLQEVHLVEE